MDTDESTGRLGELFLRVGKRMRAMQAERFAPLGLTPAQGRMLSRIAGNPTPPRMAELAEQLGVVPRAVTPQVDALEEAGLVRRRTDPDNRRSTLIELTARGADVLRGLRIERVRAAEELFAPLSHRQRAALLRMLETVAADGT